MSLPVTFVTVREPEGHVAIGYDDLVRYAGPGQIVAAALCLRLFERAFRDLSPAQPPLRDDVRVTVGFPGPGILDAVEMITRARSRDRLRVDLALGAPAAPPALIGRLAFTIAVAAARRSYAVADGLFTPAFLDQVRAYQDGGGDTAQRAAYLRAKCDLIARLLATPDADLFHPFEANQP